MKYLNLAILVFFVVLLINSFTTISFKPFKIQFHSLYILFGWIFIITGVMLIKINAERKASEKIIKEVNEILDNKIKNLKSKKS